MSNFRARFVAELDTKKIDGDIKKINKKKVALENVTLNTKGLSAKIQAALDKHQFSLNLTNVKVDSLSKKITGQISSAGTQAGQELVKRINQQITTGGLQTSIDKVTMQYNKLFTAGAGNNQIHAQLLTVNNDLQRLDLLQKEINTTTNNNALISKYNEFETTLLRVKNTLSSVSAESRTMASTLDIATLNNKMETWLEKNTRATKNFGTQIQTLRSRLAELQTSGGATVAQLNSLEREFREIKTAAVAAGEVGRSFSSTFAAGFRSISNYVSISTIIYQAINGLKQMYQNVLKIDTAMTGLYRVTNLTTQEYKNLYDQMTESAQKYGATLDSIIDGTTTWVKLGFDANTSERLAEITSMYQHVTDLDVETATKNLVTAYKGFQSTLDSQFDTADAAIERIADIYDKLGNEYAVTAADVGAALSRSASALQVAGASIEESAGLATGIAEVTQESEKAGNSLKVVSLRLRGMKGELEELGEETDENVESISKMQTHILNLTHGKVNIFDDEGSFRNVYDILRDIADIYYDLSDTEAADLLETIAGKHRANDIAALISNWSQVESATEAAYNAAGTATTEQEKYMESLQGHLNQLEASWQVFSNSFLENDFLKQLVDLASAFLSIITKVVDTFGTLPTLIVAVITALSIKNVGRAEMLAHNDSGKMPTVVVFYLDINSLASTPNEIHLDKRVLYSCLYYNLCKSR